MTYQIIPLPIRAIDLSGKVFGRLTAIAPVGKNCRNLIMWLCICKCGTENVTRGAALTHGNAQSCGCLRSDVVSAAKSTHRMSRRPEYHAFYSAKGRCNNKQDRAYHNYGGRGIRFLYRDFEHFYTDVGAKPSNTHTLDRVDNNGNYEHGNCRWSSRCEQARNRRTNIMIEHNGQSMCMADWAEFAGIDYDSFKYRIRSGWDIGKTITTLTRKRGE